MKFAGQRRLAAALSKRTVKRIRFSPEKLNDIKEAITRADIRGLLASDAIKLLPKRGNSRARIRLAAKQKAKGRRRGQGRRKGTKNARLSTKSVWVARVRLQRRTLKEMKKSGKISQQSYVALYKKAGGGFFRSRRHLELYIEENKK